MKRVFFTLRYKPACFLLPGFMKKAFGWNFFTQKSFYTHFTVSLANIQRQVCPVQSDIFDRRTNDHKKHFIRVFLHFALISLHYTQFLFLLAFFHFIFVQQKSLTIKKIQ